MAKIKFTLLGKNELSNIYVRLIDGRKTDIKLNTGLVIEKEFWNATTGEIIDLEAVKERKTKVVKVLSPEEKENELQRLSKVKVVRKELEHLQNEIKTELRTGKAQGTEINREWLETVILKAKGLIKEQDTLFYNLIESYKLKLPTMVRNGKIGVAPGTIRNYNTTLQRLKKYEEAKNKQLHITDIDFNFHTDFLKFAQTKLKLSLNSIGKDIKQFKTVILDAKENGLKVNDQALTRKFNAPSEKTLFITLNEDEISDIKKFEGANHLENAKDWLIIGCWTGCRVGDLMQLSEDNVLITPKGQKFIRYTQSKTEKQVDIPLHNDVLEIIDRLGGFPRPISDQKFNEYIKTVCQEIGMTEQVYGTRQNPETHLKETGYFEKWQLVRSHICRRSFATNHYNKLPNKLIMAVTGHSTEKMLLNYIGETENDHIDDFLSVWNAANIKDEKIVELAAKTS
ncbi:MAG: hypothetical protein K0R65_2787 [Crocinitomicaceae bacterium]|jgi:integrase|nr:hypothetical protein [Crocinitomicaceae bacterium]